MTKKVTGLRTKKQILKSGRKVFLKITIVLFILFWPFLWVFGQSEQKVTLELCLEKAVVHAPENRLPAMNKASSQLKIKNIRSNYLPLLNLNGRMSYQSEVTKIPEVPIPGFDMPTINNDWYNLNLDVEQLLWDGGFTSGQKQLEKSNLELSNNKTSLQIYLRKEKVSQLFFTALFYRDKIEILHLLENSIDSELKQGEKAWKDGILLEADLNALKVEKKLTVQKMVANREDANGIIGALNELTGLNIIDLKQLESPEPKSVEYRFVNNRPDFARLVLQQNRLQTLKTLSTAKRMPLFKAFGQAGYGRPGYDLLNNNFDTYYKVGLQLYWNIWDWNKVKHEKKVLDIQNGILSVNKESMNQNLRAQLHKQEAAITKFKKLIVLDKEMIALQQTVVDKVSEQLKNGTVTATNYLMELNKLTKMQLEQKNHRLQLIYAQYQYITLTGNL